LHLNLCSDRNSDHPVRVDVPGVPDCPAHQAEWVVDQGLLNALDAEVLACRNLFLAASAPAAANHAAPAAGHGPAALAPTANNNPAPAAAQGQINPPGTGQGQAGPPVNGQGQVDLLAATDQGEAAEAGGDVQLLWDRPVTWIEITGDDEGRIYFSQDDGDDSRGEYYELMAELGP
jgi:hypothetical protein